MRACASVNVSDGSVLSSGSVENLIPSSPTTPKKVWSADEADIDSLAAEKLHRGLFSHRDVEEVLTTFRF